MQLKLVATNKDDLKKISSRSQAVLVQYQQFKMDTLFRLAESIVLKKIHDKMRQFDYDEKIILGTIVTQVQLRSARSARIFFRSHYISDTGFDVAKAREEGTEDHDLPKVEGRTYHWKTPSGSNAFSKGHRVKGIVQSNIMKDVTEEQSELLFIEFNRAKTEWLEKNFDGFGGDDSIMVEETIDIGDDLTESQMQKLARAAERANKQIEKLERQRQKKGGVFAGLAGDALPKGLGLTSSGSPIQNSGNTKTKQDAAIDKKLARLTEKVEKDVVKNLGQDQREGKLGLLGELFGGSVGAKNVLNFGKNPIQAITSIAQAIPWLGGVFAAKEIADFIIDEIIKIDKFFKEFIDRADTRARPDRELEQRARVAAGLSQEISTTLSGQTDPRDAYNTYEQFNNNQAKLEQDFQLRDTSGVL